MDPSRKRQRANTNGDATRRESSPTAALQEAPVVVPQYDLSECIEALHAADEGVFVKDLLLRLANTQPDTAKTIRLAYDVHIKRQQVQVINFDHYFHDVWNKINDQYSSLSGSKQYDMSFDVFDDVSSIIQSIAEQAGERHASFGTKASALETLRKIGMTICASSGDTLGSEVRKQFSHDSEFVDAMQTVVDALSDAECEKMCAVHDGRSTFLQKMEELKSVASGYCCFKGLAEVIDALTRAADNEEGEEEEAEEEEEEGDSDEHDSEDDGSDSVDHQGASRFGSVKESMEFLDCFDEDGAPKNDARSRRILARYHQTH
jgi:hypothetical protein